MQIRQGEKPYHTDHGIVYSCQYHIIWCPKYRRKVLINGVDTRLKELILEKQSEYGYQVIEMEVMADHVHLLLDIDPRIGVNEIVGKINWSKHDDQSIRYPQRFKLAGHKLYLPKVGWVKIVRHRSIEGEMKNCTVSKTKTGHYFVSIQCEIEKNVQPTTNTQAVGIDLGLKDFAILSSQDETTKIEPPKHLRKAENLVKIRQRRVSRKVKGSNSRNKARLVVSATHEKIANRRKDFHHQLSRRIVNQFGSIGLETLNVKGMIQNHNLAKSIADAGWSQFVNFIEYKTAWAGVEVVKHDRWFASSKTCNDCGYVKRDLTLKDRTWVCPSCGVIHDRDENAAKNLMPTTLGARESNAVGDMSSAVRRSAPEKFQAGQLTLF